MKGVHKKDGGEKSRQTWRKTVREKERKEEGEKGMHGRWIERLRKGERQTWRKRERKKDGEEKANIEREKTTRRKKDRWMEEERRMEKRDGDAGKRPSGRINAAMVHGAGERRIETEGERDGMNFVG